MPVKSRRLKIRNPLHGHPLMRKGGVHGKSNKAKRKMEKQKLRQEWRSLIMFIQMLLKNATPETRRNHDEQACFPLAVVWI